MKKNYMRLIVALLFATNLMAQNVPNYVPTNGLVGWWPFNGNANDESGNGNHGTVNGATLTSDRNGNYGSAYNFDGISNYIKCTNSGPTGNPTFSIGFWIKSAQTTYGHLIGYGNNGVSGQDFRIFINGNCNNAIAFDTYDNQKAKSTSFKNLWDFYTVTYDGKIGNNTSIVKIYKNGIIMSSECFNVNISKTNISQLIPITFGRYHGTVQKGFYKGDLDDICFFDRIITQEEIISLYTSTPPCTNPTATITPQSTTTFCEGGSVKLNASTGTNYTYEWYNNGNIINGATKNVYTATTAGNYTVKVIDGACNTSSSATTITVNANPTVSLNSLNAYTLKTSSPIQLVGNPNGGIYSGNGVANAILYPASAKLGYTIITYNYTSPQGCSGSASRSTIIADTLGNICSVTVNDTVSILKIRFQLTTGIKANTVTNITVYPNPTSDVLIIDAIDSPALAGYTYRILDVQGKQIYNALVTSSKTEISLKILGAKGVYVLHIVDANGISIENKKIVLQ